MPQPRDCDPTPRASEPLPCRGRRSASPPIRRSEPAASAPPRCSPRCGSREPPPEWRPSPGPSSKATRPPVQAVSPVRRTPEGAAVMRGRPPHPLDPSLRYGEGLCGDPRRVAAPCALGLRAPPASSAGSWRESLGSSTPLVTLHRVRASRPSPGALAVRPSAAARSACPTLHRILQILAAEAADAVWPVVSWSSSRCVTA